MSSLPFFAPGWSLLWQPTQLATRIGAMSWENVSPPVPAAALLLAFGSAFLLAPFSASRVFLRALYRGRGMSESSGTWPNGSKPPGSWTGPYCAAAGRVRPNIGTSHIAVSKRTLVRLRPRHRRMCDMMFPPLACRNLAARSLYCFSPCAP